MNKTILAGDIGGTKTLLQVAQVTGTIGNAQIHNLAERRFDSQAYDSFGQIMAEFMRQLRKSHPSTTVHSACIGVAGPVKGDYAQVTNLPWELYADSLAQDFSIETVRLINDFQAVGYGIEMLSEKDICQLQAGESQPGGVRAVIGAGTGLGHGILVWRDGRYEVLGSEAGHTSFAPTDDVQLELLRYLLQKKPNVSYELVCSGPGLENIYEFLANKQTQSAARLTAAQITQAAFDGKDSLAEQALQMFVRIYGSQAGNLALTCLATGGVYVAGGIAPKILPALQQGEFIRAFNDKSKMQHLLKTIPVAVVTNAEVGLLGTVAVAAFHS